MIHQQKNANYNIEEKLNKEVEHGFVENFCEILRIREKLRNIRMEIAEKGYAIAYPVSWGMWFLIRQFSGNVLTLKKCSNQLLTISTKVTESMDLNIW